MSQLTLLSQVDFCQCFITATENKLTEFDTIIGEMLLCWILPCEFIQLQAVLLEDCGRFWSVVLEKLLSFQSLINCCRNLKDNAMKNVDYGGLAREFSEGNKDLKT